MYHQIIVPIVFISLASWGSANEGNEPVIRREYVWQNFKDFIDYGWYEEFPGMTRTYNAPTEMDIKLYELNKNFTDEVWGWKSQDTGIGTMAYQVDIGTKPEYCGMLNATIYFKFYLEGNWAKAPTYFYPGCTTQSQWPNTCLVSNSDFATWSSLTQEVVLSKSKILAIVPRMITTGLILIDEVRLTYSVQQGISCPYSCHHECEYKGIDCHNYYTCIDNRYKDFRVCNKSEGLAFNPVTKTCDLIEKVEGCNVTRPPPPPHCACEYRPHEVDCSMYYYCPDTCHMEQCEERQCPGGLLWSVDAKGDGTGLQQCVQPARATCFNETLVTTTWPEFSTTPKDEIQNSPFFSSGFTEIN